jgi:hypothetical protein
MSLGRWKFNGDTICLNGDRLIDGQHRLMAVVKSGVTIDALVVDGLPSDVFDTKDIGKQRTAADTLSTHGEVNCRSLSAALLVVDKYITGRVSRRVQYTNIEIEDLLHKHPDIRRSVVLCLRTKKLVPPSIMAGLHYLFSRKDETAADKFVSQLISGSGLVDGDPIYVLRERIMQNSISKSKISNEYMMALIIKAWNHKRAGAMVHNLRFRQEGANPESFPVIQ